MSIIKRIRGVISIDSNDMFLEKIVFDVVFDNIDYFNERRSQMFKKIKPTTGYIVGKCYKYDGDYCSEIGNSYDDYTAASLENRKAIHYWKVAVNMTEMYLVPINKDYEDWRLLDGQKAAVYFKCANKVVI